MAELEVKVIVAMHKSYVVPRDELYLPLHVGAAVEPKKRIVDVSSIELSEERIVADEIAGDDTGDNISLKNPYYSELTGLYWAWKNLSSDDADAVGLAHYRRHFTVKNKASVRVNGLSKSLLTEAQARNLFARADIIVPKRRDYVIETLYSHYAHTLDSVHLDIAREIINEKYPEYKAYVEMVYEQRTGHMFNMMILKREDLDNYCSFLFTVLEELEERLGGEEYLATLSSFEARLFGRVSEILFNVWLEKRRLEGARICEIGHVSTEPVNWLKKGGSFLAAKFLGKKYEASF